MTSKESEMISYSERPSGVIDEGNEPVLVRGSGPHLVQRWVLEEDMTRYEAIVVFDIESNDDDLGNAGAGPQYALVCVNVAGGGGREHGRRAERWTVSGGGAWYEFSTEGFLALEYVKEKFRLNDADGWHVTKLLRKALGR